MPLAFASAHAILPALGARLRSTALHVLLPRPHTACRQSRRASFLACTPGPPKPRTRRRMNMAIADNAGSEAAMLHKGGLIAAKLAEVYPEAPEGFLDHSDPFTLLVAVLLSAQSLDKKVNAVTPQLFLEGGTPATMRALGEARIRELIREVGLSPQKAANLAKLSAKLEDEHGGAVPQTFAELEALPGVGHKTASVVMIQAFGHPAFPVDTHIHRLACRWGAGDAKSVDRTEAALKKWFPDPASWQDLHTRIILFGREHCPARKHDMATCPICSFAATDEARAANAASPNKFVAAKNHKNPFAVRDGVDVEVPAEVGGKDGAGSGKNVEPRATKKKRAAARSKKTDEEGSDDDFMPSAAKKKRTVASAKKTAASTKKTAAHPRNPRAGVKRKKPDPEADEADVDVDNERDDGTGVVSEPAAKRKRTSRPKKTAKTGATAREVRKEDAPKATGGQGSGTDGVRTSARIRARKEAAA